MRISDWSSDVCSSDLNDRQRHRREGLAFDASEREQRHIDEDDDRLPEHGRADHFAGGMRYDRQPFVECERAAVMMLPLSAASQRLLADDDRALDDPARVQPPGGPQLGRDAPPPNATHRYLTV